MGLIWLVVGWGFLHYSLNWFTDALAYYRLDPEMPYRQISPGVAGIFTYSPIAAQLFVLLHRIPEPMFLGAWLALNVGILVWLARPAPWVAVALAAPIADELITGQIELILVAAIVLGMRRPAFWAIPVSTKVLPGIGILWFAVRREWRALATALVAIGTLVLVSFTIAPDWWAAWITFLEGSSVGDARLILVLRLLIAAGIVIYAARSDRPSLLPIATLLALPIVWLHSLSMLVAIPILRHRPPGTP